MITTVWGETSRESMLDLMADMFDDLRCDHLSLVEDVCKAIDLIENGKIDDGLTIIQEAIEGRIAP